MHSAFHFLLSFVILMAICPTEAAPTAKPNVLFIAVDDMNDWIGCLNTRTAALTPNIDKLATRGVNFSNAHTAGVYCAPSRAAIFSGQFASTTGCYQSSTYFVEHPEIESLQTSFAKAGYATYGGGKLFHHPAGNIDTRDWTEFCGCTQATQQPGGEPADKGRQDAGRLGGKAQQKGAIRGGRALGE